MKKITYITLLMVSIFIMNGCVKEVGIPKEFKTEDIKIGVVETRSTDYKSIIHWYDDDLNKVFDQKLKYADLGDTWRKPVYYDNQVYIIPVGLMGRQDSKLVISIDEDDFKIKEFEIDDTGLQALAVNEDYIYTSSNLNRVAYITRTNKSDNKSIQLAIDNIYITGLLAIEDKLYSFHDNGDGLNRNFCLDIYNQDLELLKTIEDSRYGADQYKYLYDKEDKVIYTTMQYDSDDEIYGLLLKIHTDTYEIESIDLKEEFPDAILDYKDTIIISHYNLVGCIGSKISLLDKKTQEFTTIDLERRVDYVDILENQLVVVNEETISLFDIDNNFKLIKETSIPYIEDSYYSTSIIIR